MPRTFTYARVSTLEQEPENQIREIEAAGFKVEPHRIIRKTVSDSVAIAQRKGFARLVDKMETGDVLVVTKLDRLGRNAADVSTTVATLEKMGIRVHCLAYRRAYRNVQAGGMQKLFPDSRLWLGLNRIRSSAFSRQTQPLSPPLHLRPR